MTVLYMERWSLITTAIKWLGDSLTINDDLDSLYQGLRQGQEPEEYVRTYFVPQLTENEMKGLRKSHFKRAYMQGIEKNWRDTKIKSSESDSWFIEGSCHRLSFTIENTWSEILAAKMAVYTNGCCSIQ